MEKGKFAPSAKGLPQTVAGSLFRDNMIWILVAVKGGATVAVAA